jgi:hypothetical protein
LPKADAIKQGLNYYFDEDKAAHAVAFFEQFLIHSKGRFAGKPFTLLPWQKHDVIEEIFGFMRVETDTRKHRVGYIEVPKKNGVLAPAAGCRGGQDAEQEKARSSPASASTRCVQTRSQRQSVSAVPRPENRLASSTSR